MSERCKQEVADYSMRFPRYHRCSFKAKKDGYCTMHHPDSVKAREEKKRILHEEQRAKSPYVLLQKSNERVQELERENEALRKALQEIFDMPCCMVNDSESLRHTIKTIRFIAENAIKEQSHA